MIERSEECQRRIEDHRYLCSRAARKFLRAGLDRRDLEQVAAIGLIKASDRFDVGAGTPFEAYAWVFVLGELMHYVRDCERVLRVPRRLQELERKCVLAERELWVRLGREPSDEEIGAIANVTPSEHYEVRRCRDVASVVSVEALRPYDHRSLSYTIEEQTDRLFLDGLMGHLSALEREILTEIYERDTPMIELARRLGYSRRHLTRLHRGALQKVSSLARPQIA